MYVSQRQERHSTTSFANDSADGRVRQWKIAAKGGKIAGEMVREIVVGSRCRRLRGG